MNDRGFNFLFAFFVLIQIAFLGLLGWGIVELIQFIGRH